MHPYTGISQETAAKQPNSRMCFVCGMENPSGLHAHFYQLDDSTCVARFVPDASHQGYPGRVHGGVVAAILDETMGRAIWSDLTQWGVTVELNLRYKAPVPLDETLTIVGRLTADSRRVFEAEGQLLLADGTVAVTAQGKFVKIALERILDEGSLSDPNLELFIVPDVQERP